MMNLLFGICNPSFFSIFRDLIWSINIQMREFHCQIRFNCFHVREQCIKKKAGGRRQNKEEAESGKMRLIHVRMCVKQFFVDYNLWQKTLFFNTSLPFQSSERVCLLQARWKTHSQHKENVSIFYARGVLDAGSNILCRSSMAAAKQICSWAHFSVCLWSHVIDKAIFLSFFLYSLCLVLLRSGKDDQAQQQMGNFCIQTSNDVKKSSFSWLVSLWGMDKSFPDLFCLYRCFNIASQASASWWMFRVF